MKYTVQWHYRSSLGVLTRGETLELEAEQAAAYNRDSPGVLVEVKPKRAKPKGTKTRMVTAPEKDRDK